jgi:hypothetical protein
METKPADLFIGVVDLFAIILPGALISYVVSDTVAHHVGSLKIPAEGTAQGWVAFALSSYLLGHFASLVGAFFLDPLYERTYVKLRTRSGDQLHKQAGELRAKTPGTDNVTNYKWARTALRIGNVDAMQEVDRLEADSKFFRSITVVLPIFAWKIMSAHVSISGVLLWTIVALLSFWRFSNLRWKATEAAYLAMTVLDNVRARER